MKVQMSTATERDAGRYGKIESYDDSMTMDC